MASFTGLAAGRHRVLERTGWNVEEDGLTGAPEIAVVVGAEAHVTIHVSLQMLGLGRNRVHKVEADGQGRMRPDSLREVLAGPPGSAGPRLRPVGQRQHRRVRSAAGDRRRGPRAAERVAPRRRGVRAVGGRVTDASGTSTAGLADADSWTTDAHKWLNVPYDSGISIVRDVAAHHAAMTLGAAYYVETGRSASATRTTGSRSRRGAPAASRSTPRSASWAATGSRR